MRHSVLAKGLPSRRSVVRAAKAEELWGSTFRWVVLGLSLLTRRPRRTDIALRRAGVAMSRATLPARDDLKAVALQALSRGHTVRFVTASDMLLRED